MSENKKNCWEVLLCGRGPGGNCVAVEGLCPAATDVRFHGIHGGRNAGRTCWAVAGTQCGGKGCGTFAQKYGDCMKCVFFLQVVREEGAGFIASRKLAGTIAQLFEEKTEPVVEAETNESSLYELCRR